ncbi:MAG TPA: proline--tRNA ligase, partial [Bacillota bacterium]|nr:proline--tRNA ligase [Bacillota bacterium]
DFCLGPTHEEVFVDVARQNIDSYRQLPFSLYQIQTKYRDEARPRFGLIRSREFIMKDNYSFDKDEAGLDVSYQDMYDAYSRVFDRCGLNYRVVEADSGAIGGSNSHEFCALSEVGEENIVFCDACGMAATDERADFKDAAPSSEPELPMREVHTPGTKSIEDVCAYLELPKEKSIKALLLELYNDELTEIKGYVAAFVRGDRQLNMTKLVNALGCHQYAIAFANEDRMQELTGSVGGFTGPTGLRNCTIVVDSELVGLKNMCAGACKEDHHIINVNYGRDYKADIIADLKLLQAGDPCPVCGTPVSEAKGIEVGQIFKLGTKYSEPMGLSYKDENQKEHPVVMGC